MVKDCIFRLFRASLPLCVVVLAAAMGSSYAKSKVQPLIKITSGLFDQEKPESLGLNLIHGEHRILFRATAESYKFCHHQNIGIYQDRLYVMWSNGIVHEDHNGQRILYSHTADGTNWSKPAILATDHDGLDRPLVSVSAGFHVSGRTLVAYFTSIVEKSPTHEKNTLFYKTSRDGLTWSRSKRLVQGFFIESPKRLASGRLLMNGQWANKQPRLMYSDSPDGITGWKDGKIRPVEIFTFPEPSWFQRRNGTIVMLFRTRSENANAWIYASTSSDNGQSWTLPMKTNFPDATSRISAGNLPDGTAFVINNPSHSLGSVYKFIGRRSPLCIALSYDQEIFIRAYVIHQEKTQPRFEGNNKLPGWQYPAAIVWKNHLYIVYSINKEDAGVTRIGLSDLFGVGSKAPFGKN